MIFPHTITLLKKIVTESTYSGISISYPATGTDYRAYMQPRAGGTSEINMTAGVRDAWVCYAEPGCPIEVLDHFVFESETYEVTDKGLQYSPRGPHHVKLTAVKVSQL